MIQVLSNTWYWGGKTTHPYRDASPRRATVAYRFMPAANENPSVRPRKISVSISATSCRPAPGRSQSASSRLPRGCCGASARISLQQRLHPPTDLGDEGVAIVHRQANRFHRFAYPDVHRHGTHDGASLAHRGASAGHGDGDDRRLRLDRHDEAALLERQQRFGAAPRALRE